MPSAHSRDPWLLRHSKLRVDFAANRSYRPVAHHRQRSAQVHARREPCLGMPLKIGPLIGKPHTRHGVSFNQRFGNRHARPDLHHIPTLPLDR